MPRHSSSPSSRRPRPGRIFVSGGRSSGTSFWGLSWRRRWRRKSERGRSQPADQPGAVPTQIYFWHRKFAANRRAVFGHGQFRLAELMYHFRAYQIWTKEWSSTFWQNHILFLIQCSSSYQFNWGAHKFTIYQIEIEKPLRSCILLICETAKGIIIPRCQKTIRMVNHRNFYMTLMLTEDLSESEECYILSMILIDEWKKVHLIGYWEFPHRVVLYPSPFNFRLVYGVNCIAGFCPKLSHLLKYRYLVKCQLCTLKWFCARTITRKITNVKHNGMQCWI